MTNPPFPRRPRRIFPPEVARRIRIENAAMAFGTILFWIAIGGKRSVMAALRE